MFEPWLRSSWFVLAVVAGVVLFLGWAMKRMEKNHADHLIKSKVLYDDQLASTKQLYDQSNQLRAQMLDELKEIRKLLGNRKS
jgi:hypothetical protein